MIPLLIPNKEKKSKRPAAQRENEQKQSCYRLQQGFTLSSSYSDQQPDE